MIETCNRFLRNSITGLLNGLGVRHIVWLAGALLVMFLLTMVVYVAWCHFSEEGLLLQGAGGMLRGMEVWDLVHQWHNVAYQGRDRFVDGRPKVFAVQPHGSLPQGTLATLSLHGGTWPTEEPPLVIAAHFLLFVVPGVRELVSLLGGFNATDDGMRRALRRGQNVGILPEGAGGRGNTSPTRVMVDVSRSGFLRVAAEEGVDVVPVFIGGQNRAMRQQHVGWLNRLTERWIGWPLGVIDIGPFPSRMTVHFGERIPTKNRSIADVHRDLKEGVRRLVAEAAPLHPKTQMTVGVEPEVPRGRWVSS